MLTDSLLNCRLFISAVTLAPLVAQLLSIAIWSNLHNVELHPGLYFEPGTKFLTGYSGLLILNDTGKRTAQNMEIFLQHWQEAALAKNGLHFSIEGNGEIIRALLFPSIHGYYHQQSKK